MTELYEGDFLRMLGVQSAFDSGGCKATRTGECWHSSATEQDTATSIHDRLACAEASRAH